MAKEEEVEDTTEKVEDKEEKEDKVEEKAEKLETDEKEKVDEKAHQQSLDPQSGWNALLWDFVEVFGWTVATSFVNTKEILGGIQVVGECFV